MPLVLALISLGVQADLSDCENVIWESLAAQGGFLLEQRPQGGRKFLV